MHPLSAILRRALMAACCVLSGCTVDLAHLQLSSRDGGADGRLADAECEPAVGHRPDSSARQDGQPASRFDGIGFASDPVQRDVPAGPGLDSVGDGRGDADGAAGGAPTEARETGPADAAKLEILDADRDLPSREPDTTGSLAEDATGIADLGFDSPLVMDVASADDSADVPDASSEANTPLDAPADTSLGRDVSPDLLLPPLTCPTTIEGSLDSSDPVQTGRHSRIAPTSTCQRVKEAPGTGPDRGNPHLYDLYRFQNPSDSTACFTFTLTYSGAQLYATAYSHFNPDDINADYLGDVGAALDSPQTMGISVPGKTTIELVVYAIAVGTDPAGSYTLTCSTR